MGFTYDYYLTETQYEDTVTPTRSQPAHAGTGAH